MTNKISSSYYQRRSLPTCFHNSWQIAIESHFTETNTTQTEFSQEPARTSALAAPIVPLDLKFRLASGLSY